MRFTTFQKASTSFQARGRKTVRQRGPVGTGGARARLWAAGVLLSATALGGCADDLSVGTIGYVEGFSGVLAADEPQAVLVGRDVLSAGGLAADAAVAMGFTLTVTLPSSAGIGGGGLCLDYDAEADKVTAFEFLPNASSPIGPKGSMAVPATARGLFALHAQSGSMRWESLLAPAENLARFGFPASRALAQHMVDFPRGPGSEDSFLAQGVVEGQRLAPHDLAGTIGRIRQRGPGEMHDGAMARQMVDAAQLAGYGLTLQDLRGELPKVERPASREEGNEVLYTYGVPTLGMPPAYGAPGATGYVVADSLGNAVACTLSMGRPFGSGMEMPDMGFLISPIPGADSGGEALATLLKVNHNVEAFHLGIAAAGDGAPALLEAIHDGVLSAGTSRWPQDIVNDLAPNFPQARANVASCPKGIPRNPENCGAAVDPMGAGYGLRAGE